MEILQGKCFLVKNIVMIRVTKRVSESSFPSNRIYCDLYRQRIEVFKKCRYDKFMNCGRKRNFSRAIEFFNLLYSHKVKLSCRSD